MTICKTLTVLAEAGGRGSVRLPLDYDLYPPVSRAAAAEAFSEVCTVRPVSESTLEISLVDKAADARQVVGELLNYMLSHALQQRSGGGRLREGEAA